VLNVFVANKVLSLSLSFKLFFVVAVAAWSSHDSVVEAIDSYLAVVNYRLDCRSLLKNQGLLEGCLLGVG